MSKWMRALYQPNLPLSEDGYVTASAAHRDLSLRAAKEGMVLLKNENGLLPLREGSHVALFGKASFDYVKGGGGSGDVTVAYVRNIHDGLRNAGVHLCKALSDYYSEYVNSRLEQGDVPGMMPEADLPDALVESAKKEADVAVIVISRFSGEGWDRFAPYFNDEEAAPHWPDEEKMPTLAAEYFPEGDYYLTTAEKKMVEKVCTAFDKVAVVLNVGGVVDVSWFSSNDRISSALMAFQGGMEGGRAVADLLIGRDNPSAKLPDTYAHDIKDYPSTENFNESPYYVDYNEDIYVGYRYFETLPNENGKVCYPFGYGLSYTTFCLEPIAAGDKDGQIRVAVRVTNTGDVAGKEVVQLYFGAPQGQLQKPARCLGAFEKTKLLEPGESQIVELSLAAADMASFDDLGKVKRSSFVLEKGRYALYVGTSVRDVETLAYGYEQPETQIVCTVSDSLAPTELSKRLLADGTLESLPTAEPKDWDALERMPRGSEEAVCPAVTGRERYSLLAPYKGTPLSEVAAGNITLEDFIGQLTDDELIHLLGGQPNTSVSNTFGMGNLPERGVPNITTADGPAGLRLTPECGVKTTAWPISTLLAATWNKELVFEVGAAAAAEVKENNIGVWLAPAVNIHRSPLCGRNFEYWSEDPVLAGKLAASMIRGIQSVHVAACIKHFAANNKETNRKYSDSRVSQRALRELYLKVFEIALRESDPWMIMSSYNKINGRRASESSELLEDILRDDWGYDGLVTTDWWTRGEHYKEVLAGNNLKMGTGYPERVKQAMDMGLVTRKDLEKNARRVLEMILKMD